MITSINNLINIKKYCTFVILIKDPVVYDIWYIHIFHALDILDPVVYDIPVMDPVVYDIMDRVVYYIMDPVVYDILDPSQDIPIHIFVYNKTYGNNVSWKLSTWVTIIA